MPIRYTVLMARKIFPDTMEFHLFAGDHQVAVMHVETEGFEGMAGAIARKALLHARLRGEVIKAYFAGADEPVLNAYPQGYTEVYR